MKPTAPKPNAPAFHRHVPSAPPATQGMPATSDGYPAWLTQHGLPGSNAWGNWKRPEGQVRRPWGEVFDAPGPLTALQPRFEIPGKTLTEIVADAGQPAAPVVARDAAPVKPEARSNQWLMTAPMAEVRQYQKDVATYARWAALQPSVAPPTVASPTGGA